MQGALQAEAFFENAEDIINEEDVEESMIMDTARESRQIESSQRDDDSALKKWEAEISKMTETDKPADKVLQEKGTN